MRIDTFKIEEWMNRYCSSAKIDLTSTCIEPLSLRELLNICNISSTLDISNEKLTYGEIHGTQRLKNAIKSLYQNQENQNITVTHGAIGANQLVFESILEKGDEVLVFLPIYQQLYSVPKSLGANVKFIYLREENKWMPNIRELENNLTRKTKLICINNPNNPTGSLIPDEMLKRIVEIAKNNNSWVLSDEAYRGLNLIGNAYSTSVADIYEKGISTGSMSKTYSLPGLRVGWICGREDLIKEVNKHREYNTISISLLDEYFSAIALENKENIAIRNFQIMKNGLQVLVDWLNEDVYFRANIPQAGTTALVRYKKEIPSKHLCRTLQESTGVAILPGETMDMEGFVRIGFCTEPQKLKTGLKYLSQHLRKL